MTMAKSKTNPIEGYFFMSIINGDVNIDCSGKNSALSAGFASIFVNNDKKGADVKSILSTAIAIAAAELDSAKESNWEKVKVPKKKSNPKQMDGVESKEPFVKTRKKKSTK